MIEKLQEVSALCPRLSNVTLVISLGARAADAFGGRGDAARLRVARRARRHAPGGRDPALRPPAGRLGRAALQREAAPQRQAALHRSHRRHGRQNSPQQPDRRRGHPSRAAPGQVVRFAPLNLLTLSWTFYPHDLGKRLVS